MAEATETVAEPVASAEDAAAGLAMIDKLLDRQEGQAEVEAENTDAPEEGKAEGEGAGDPPKAEEGENPDLEEQNSEEQGAEEGNEPEPKAEPVAEAPPVKPVAEKPPEKPTAETVQKTDLRAARKAINQKIADLRAQIKAKRDAGSFDVIEDNDLVANLQDAVAEATQIQEQYLQQVDEEVLTPKEKEAAAEAYWNGWKDPDVDVETAQDAWEACIETARGESSDEKEILAVAKYAFKQKLAQIRGGKKTAAEQKSREEQKAKAPVPKVPAKAANPKAPPVNKGAANLTPNAPIRTVRAPAELVASEELKQKILNL